MSALSRPVLHPPCEQCGEPEAHADECEGEPHPESLHQALARAQASADKRTREQARRYLSTTGVPTRLGALSQGKVCSPCRGNPRYPDHRCAEHTVHLHEPTPQGRRDADNDEQRRILVWRSFFERVGLILKS